MTKAKPLADSGIDSHDGDSGADKIKVDTKRKSSIIIIKKQTGRSPRSDATRRPLVRSLVQHWEIIKVLMSLMMRMKLNVDVVTKQLL